MQREAQCEDSRWTRCGSQSCTLSLSPVNGMARGTAEVELSQLATTAGEAFDGAH